MGEVVGNIEVSNYIDVKRLDARIDGVAQDIKGLRSDVAHVVKGMETTRKSDALITDMSEKIRKMDMRLNHLDGISTPAWYEMELHDIKEIVYKLQNEVREEVNNWKKFRESNYFQVVTYEEMLNTYKMSGITLSILADKLHVDLTGLSKWLNGHRKSHDYELYHKIKQACLEYASKTQK